MEALFSFGAGVWFMIIVAVVAVAGYLYRNKIKAFFTNFGDGEK